jgi:hypothetical protein
MPRGQKNCTIELGHGAAFIDPLSCQIEKMHKKHALAPDASSRIDPFPRCRIAIEVKYE